jgi:hypothetical protein
VSVCAQIDEFLIGYFSGENVKKNIGTCLGEVRCGVLVFVWLFVHIYCFGFESFDTSLSPLSNFAIGSDFISSKDVLN